MSPALPRLNTTNGVFTNAIFSRYFSLKARICADRPNLCLGQFGRSAAFTTIRSAVFGAIQLIVARRIPTKIANVVIPRIAVIVATLHALWSGANKCGQHQRMRLKNFKFVVFPQSQKRAIIKFVFCKNFNSFGFCGTHSAIVRNFVKTFISFNIKPNFHGSPFMLHMGNIP
jgi:hypothetical protein